MPRLQPARTEGIEPMSLNRPKKRTIPNMRDVSRCSFHDNHKLQRFLSSWIFRSSTQRPLFTLDFPRIKGRGPR